MTSLAFMLVWVRLRAAARLPDAEREVLVEFSFDDFFAGLHDQVRFVGWKFSELLVHLRRRLFEYAEGAD